jgi:hypothetical protein
MTLVSIGMSSLDACLPPSPFDVKVEVAGERQARTGQDLVYSGVHNWYLLPNMNTTE